MASAMAPTPTRGALRDGACVHEVAGWRIKVYQRDPVAMHGARLADALSLVVSTAKLRCSDSRLPVGFCIVTKSGGDVAEAVLGLWAVSKAARLVLLNAQPGGVFVARNDFPLECAEIVAFEARAMKAACTDLRSCADAAQGYLSEWFCGDATHVSHAAMHATFQRFASHWQRGDIDALMSELSDAPSYRTSAGASFEGREAVRRGLTDMCKPASSAPAAEPAPQDIEFFGNKSLSYWSLALPDGIGGQRQVQGVDVITYDADGRIALKDAYRKVS